MTEYRRASIPGATWFFTVNLAERKGNRLLVEEIAALRNAFHSVQAVHPFRVTASVVLPDHGIWMLPPRDSDFSTRWGLIKGTFSRSIKKGERLSTSRGQRGERGLWQRRIWKHLIRDEDDVARHVDYIPWTPFKYGWVNRVAEWPHSSFHVFLRRGVSAAFGGGGVIVLEAGE